MKWLFQYLVSWHASRITYPYQKNLIFDYPHQNVLNQQSFYHYRKLQLVPTDQYPFQSIEKLMRSVFVASLHLDVFPQNFFLLRLHCSQNKFPQGFNIWFPWHHSNMPENYPNESGKITCPLPMLRQLPHPKLIKVIVWVGWVFMQLKGHIHSGLHLALRYSMCGFQAPH